MITQALWREPGYNGSGKRMLTDDDKQWMLAQFVRVSERDREWVLAQFETEREWKLERLERFGAKLLAAFNTGSTPAEMRLRTHSAVLRAVALEAKAVSERVSKLEGTA